MTATAETAGFTLLRIKRKRNEEPLEGLVVDIPRKRQRDEFSDRNRGLFKYVDTVEDDNFFKDPSNAQHLQNKISSLNDAMDDTASASGSASRFREGPSSPRPTDSSLQYNLVKAPKPRSDTLMDHVASLNLAGAASKAPPAPQGFTLYDAQTSPDNGSSLNLDDGGDPEMSRFNDMVREYLQEHSPEVLMRGSGSATPAMAVEPESGDDFVYDVFYYQKPGVVGQDPSAGRNVAFLTIRPEDEVEFLSLSDDDSDEEFVDNDDPDSNDEDNPNNDYPDEESSDGSFGDGFHDGGSDYDMRDDEDY